MIKALLKKQFAEVFRGYFYNQKTGKKRSAAGVVLLFVLFALLMVGCIGGMFAGIGLSLAPTLIATNYGWLYFVIFGILSLALGVFGSVFNTYTTLYLAKDNDLLLSMPIPVRTVMISRLLTVYLLGLMYSFFVIAPASVVYLIFAFSVRTLLGCVVITLFLSLIVFILSCLLGWVVAKISRKLKGKSFVAVLASLAFIAIYYVAYFKAQEWMTALLENPADYAGNIESGALLLKYFGEIGEGNFKAMLLFGFIIAVLLVAVFVAMKRSFLKIATTATVVGRKKTTKAEGVRPSFTALFVKEIRRLFSSSLYMLNCALGALLLPILGIVLAAKGNDVGTLLAELGDFETVLPVAVCLITCMMLGMINTAVPSVSLEGKSLWILQSLPVNWKEVLGAKLMLQLFLSIVPGLFFITCAVSVIQMNTVEVLCVILCFLAFCVFAGMANMAFSLLFANVNWTNEAVPIKQNIGILIATFGVWIVAILAFVIYLPVSVFLPPAVYLGVLGIFFTVWSLLLGLYVFNRGPRKLKEL